MKRWILWLMLLLVAGDIGAQTRDEKRDARQLRRKERKARYTAQIDSLVEVGAFKFSPMTLQREPDGGQRQLANAEYGLTLWDGTADICLPYIRNKIPPYKLTRLDYTVGNLEDYSVERVGERWKVRFRTHLFSSAEYDFEFLIDSRTANTRLTISNTWYNPVRYDGTVSEVY